MNDLTNPEGDARSRIAHHSENELLSLLSPDGIQIRRCGSTWYVRNLIRPFKSSASSLTEALRAMATQTLLHLQTQFYEAEKRLAEFP